VPEDLASDAREEFDVAVQRLLRTIDGGEAASTADLDRIQRVLANFLAARFPDLGDPDDVASEAVARFTQAAQQGLVDARRRPAAYLIRIARNASLDRLRQEGRVDVVPEPPDLEGGLDDQAIVQLLNRDASCHLVSDAISAANLAGDHMVVVIVTIWLDLAESLSQAPTTREVGERAGVSHTTVVDALKRFRGCFPEQASDS
jgi:hypothetical protein